MDEFISLLQAKLKRYPNNDTLKRAVSLITDPGQEHDSSTFQDSLQASFNELQTQDIWEGPDESHRLSEKLSLALGKLSGLSDASGAQHSDKFSIVPPPDLDAGTLFHTPAHPRLLPPELVDLLNHTCLLHLLATDSDKVVQPGKSLVSVLSRPRSERRSEGRHTLHGKVEDIVHKAFWDQAIEALSNPEPSIQLLRLKGLYKDIHEALSPLFPQRHSIIAFLTSPLPPTSSPLISALGQLRDILHGLLERCAPARDQDIHSLINALDFHSSQVSRTELASLVANTVKSILKLSDVMKDDVSQVMLSGVSEDQARHMIAQEAKKLERSVTLEIWGPECLIAEWEAWLQLKPSKSVLSGMNVEPSRRWISRLLECLSQNKPVVCALPEDNLSESGEDINELPPVFFFNGPALVYLQNFLQALVIAASLRSLIRLSPPSKGVIPPENSQSVPNIWEPRLFMERVWPLLKAEVDEEEGASDTKLVNLADEVLHAQELAASASGITLSTEEKTRLRAAVDRTLRPDDPAFALLQRRLYHALVGWTVQAQMRPRDAEMPREMRAGRRPRLSTDLDREGIRTRTEPPRILAIRGFEDPVLARAVEEAFKKFLENVLWTNSVWHDILSSGRMSTN
ncbi:hypothetical protein CONPUDRAFT_121615 [Coniophora puteana RWD-64-598 SS2]|uniref:Uncharacterized protein n=1 Tax=Coniophora puteana (strain RWD-64-598) TaxID=741705 RepID=A0A5M3MWN2_CONPW|nr:uncharacterized protein CONPUDRAFT_121615 [Coniophora puteana RWD-64-598 SS2]EIW83164.1 hypothetical protein CONPUDRAFT_121615 [Coniophora puteana RWD-64-598 SS2]